MFRKYMIAICFLVAIGCGSARADLVTNGGFETGDFTGWTLGPSPSAANIFLDVSFPNTGCCDAAFSDPSGTTPASTLSQSLSAVSGALSYNLSFAILDESGLSGDIFTVNLGNFSEQFTGDQAPGSYTLEFFNLSPSDFGTGLLSFQGTNDNSAWNLDDVSVNAVVVTSVPEPSTLVLLLTALAAIGILKFHRRRSSVVSNHLRPVTA